MDQRRPAEQLRSYPRDLLVIVTADERLDRGEHLVDRVPVHAQHLRSDHLAVGLGGRGHEQALAEPVELDRQAQLRVLAALARQDERVPVAERPQQPHHAGQDLGVRQAGHILGEPGHRGVELGLRYLAERRIRPALDLTGEERQVGAPALVARHGRRVDDAEHLAHGLVAEQWLPVLVALRAAEIPQTEAERPAQLPHRALVIAEPDVAGGHPVGDLGGEYGLDLVPVQPDAGSLRRP